MIRVRAAAAGCAAVVASVLAACGSGTTPGFVTASGTATAGVGTGAQTADAAYASAAERICRAAVAQVDAVRSPGDPGGASAASLPRWAAYFSTVAAIHEGALQQLEALPPATLGAVAVAQATELAGAVQADLDALAVAARGGDLERFDAAFEAASVDMGRANQAFQAAGLLSCG
ncbi:MAG TPA: hypothetical protein VFO60_05385 [Candidatus Dormibacteraeota bacterium]|nr:hypothetical protein [Candidatus Dormibacteraeota bacterium]